MKETTQTGHKSAYWFELFWLIKNGLKTASNFFIQMSFNFVPSTITYLLFCMEFVYMINQGDH